MLHNLLALLPELLDQLVDKLSFSFELQLLLPTFLVFLHLFFLELLLACPHKFLAQITLVLALPLEIIGHPLHFLHKEGPVRLLLQAYFLGLDFSADIISQLAERGIQQISFFSELVNETLKIK